MADKTKGDVVASELEITEAAESKRKALTECNLPDKSLQEILKKGTAHENPANDDRRPSGSGN